VSLWGHLRTISEGLWRDIARVPTAGIEKIIKEPSDNEIKESRRANHAGRREYVPQGSVCRQVCHSEALQSL
jgi:hypothetical protein